MVKTAQVASKFENKKLIVQILHETLGIKLMALFYWKLKMRKNNVGNFSELLVCGDITTTSCTDLAHCHTVNRIGSILHSKRHYTVL